jgi:hypothetical protein
MFKQALLSVVASSAMLGSPLVASAQTMSASPMASPMATMMASPMASTMASPMSGSMGSSMGGMEHGMPEGKMGGDGVTYTGAPDLQGAVSLVVAGGPIGSFSVVKAITVMAGAKTANAEVAKLTKQYGADKVTSFVTVQNFAVDDAVKKATAAGVKFPKPMLTGAALAKRVVGAGLVDGTYYEGTQLDKLVTHAIHEAVMVDIDAKYGAAADANYHRIADQAHYDLAHALGVTSVKLAAYH